MAHRRGRGTTMLTWDAGEPIGLAMVTSHSDSPLFAAARTWAVDHGHEEMQLYGTSINERPPFLCSVWIPFREAVDRLVEKCL